jgi:pSer/pThr/pTyr-binding forkhead associated (FHA) protein
MKQPPAIVVQLIHIQGPLKGEIQEFFGNAITIGRHPSCHLRFPSDLTVISRKHAEILREGNVFKLVDHSTNGTFVNGKRITETHLKGGDVLEFSEGGPKVSFLTEMREGAPDPRPHVPPPRTEAPEPAPPERRAPQRTAPPAEPPAQPAAEAVSFAAPPRDPALADGPAPNAKVPLVIQYGPTLRSYRELPVTIGRHPRCQFVLDHPAILDQHAQIFYVDGRYWVKDLTGRRLVEINRQPVNLQASLGADDELALAPKGPVFRFLGQGRLAEVAEPSGGSPPKGPQQPPSGDREPPSAKGETRGGVFSRFRKRND